MGAIGLVCNSFGFYSFELLERAATRAGIIALGKIASPRGFCLPVV
jgi:hypothetical protein